MTNNSATSKVKKKASINITQAKLDSVFRAAPIGIGLVSDRVILEVNDRLSAMLEYSREELVEKNARMLYPSDKEYEFVGKDKYAQIRQSGIGTVETRWVRKDGTIIDILLSSAPIRPKDLSAGVTFTALDITAQKRAFEKLRESEEKFRLISEQSVLGILIVQDDLIKYVNQAASDILGYSIEEMLNWAPKECFSRIIHPDDMAFVMEQARRKQIGEKGYFINYTWKAITKDNKIKWVETYSKPIQLGVRFADLVAMIDVTKNKQVEDALQESEKKFRDIFELAGDVILMADRTGNILGINQRAELLTGYTHKELLGMNLFKDLIIPADQKQIKNALSDLIAGKNISYKTRWKAKDGSLISFEGNSTPKMSKEGRFICTRCILRDVTSRKHD